MLFRKYHIYLFLLIFLMFSSVRAEASPPPFPPGTFDVTMPNVSGIRTDLLKHIAPIIQQSIAEGKYPGAIVLAAHRGHIIYRGIFGSRRILPDVAPMNFNTIFDVASLTKVVATTPAIMQLVEQGKLDLDAPVEKYWPEFAAHGKEAVTVRDLLTHSSGLPADLASPAHGEAEILRQIAQLKLSHPAGTHYLYSDINFIVLAYLVEHLSQESFVQYTQNHIFKLLKMDDTSFLPAPQLRDRIAPTEMINHELRWGVVHDPMAHAMGGISGNAGLFSTAANLGVYAQCLLDNGRLPVAAPRNKKPRYLLGPLTVLKMTTPQTLPMLAEIRGLGWDIDSPYSNRGVLFPVQSFGHTGWTGTSLWIDPVTQTWIVVLTSRTHPTAAGNNQIVQDRRAIANIIAASLTDIPTINQHNTGHGELIRAYPQIEIAATTRDRG